MVCSTKYVPFVTRLSFNGRLFSRVLYRRVRSFFDIDSDPVFLPGKYNPECAVLQHTRKSALTLTNCERLLRIVPVYGDGCERGFLIVVSIILIFIESKVPIRARVNTKLDGDFTLYEDENDGYNYEKAAFATIPIHW